MMKQNLKYCLNLFLYIILFFIVFFIIYTFCMRYRSEKTIIFYFSIQIVIITACLNFTLVLLFNILIKKLSKANTIFCKFNIYFPALLINMLLGYGFIITITSLLDRSISIYALGVLNQNEEKYLSLNEMNQHFLQGFFQDKLYLKKRMYEQIQSGHVTHKKGLYKITSKGKRIYLINLFFADLFNIDDKYVRGLKSGG